MDAAYASRAPLAVQPIDVVADSERLFSPEMQRRLIWGFLAIGLAARVLRYALKFPFWDDESLFLANFVGASYGDLTGGLDYCQVAPLGFLWLELALAKLLAFDEYVLRLPSFVCGVAGLFLFRHTASRILRGPALVFAVALFAVSYPMIRYSAEAKPYGIDLFLSLILLSLVVEWRCSGMRQERWLWIIAAVIGPMMWFSYPLLFVGAATSVYIGSMLLLEWFRTDKVDALPSEADARPSRPMRPWMAWIALNLCFVVGFVSIYFASIRPQSRHDLGQMREIWIQHGAFPPITDPAAMPKWLLQAHTGALLAYPVGGTNYGSSLTALLFFLGVFVLARRRQWTLLFLLLLPLLVTFPAAALSRYPYGAMVRFNIYIGPAVCLIVGCGLAALARGWLRSPGPWARRWAVTFATLLAMIALGCMARDMYLPAKTSVDLRFRDFSRWFWFEMNEEAEVVCTRSDLGLVFSQGAWEYGFSSMYLTNQAACSPRHFRGEPPRWDRVSADRPLRCVLYRSDENAKDEEKRFDQESFDAWLDAMREHYTLVDHQSYPFRFYDKRDRRVRAKVTIETYDFIPRDAGVAFPADRIEPMLPRREGVVSRSRTLPR